MGLVSRPQGSYVQDFVLYLGKDFHPDSIFPSGLLLSRVYYLPDSALPPQKKIKNNIVLEILWPNPPGIKEWVCLLASLSCEMGTFFQGTMTKISE